MHYIVNMLSKHLLNGDHVVAVCPNCGGDISWDHNANHPGDADKTCPVCRAKITFHELHLFGGYDIHIAA